MSATITDRWLDVEERDGVAVVRFARQTVLEETTIRLLGEQLAALAERDERPNFVLNLDGLEHPSSSLIAKLFALHQRLRAAGGRLAVCCLGQDLADVFRVTALDEVMPTYPSQEEAVESFAAAGEGEPR